MKRKRENALKRKKQAGSMLVLLYENKLK